MLRRTVRLLPALFAVAALAATGAAPQAIAAPTVDSATPIPSATTPTHTKKIVVRPVTARGHAVAGWTVHRESGRADCWSRSPAGVDAGIDMCTPSAAYLPSCWKSRHHTVLCLRDVAEKKLVRMRYSGTFHRHAAARRPSPQGMVLLDGETCSIRTGGAWGEAPGHPSWVGFYSCARGSVYGPPTGDGVNRSHPLWRVHILRADGTIVTRRVQHAAFVGNAA